MTEPEPGPNQKGINRKQGVVNDKQGDVNDEVLAKLTQRQDASEAGAAGTTERRDAQHAATESRADDSDVRQDVSDTRQDVAEASAATNVEKRNAEFSAQATTNADQATINAAAVAALVNVGNAATQVTDLLRENVARGRKWTTALSVVIVIMLVAGSLAFWKIQSVINTANDQREALQAQATQIRQVAYEACLASKVRSNAVKKELTFLVNFAVGDSKSATLQKFKTDYPAHLKSVVPEIRCER